jgi:hypothetical protein
MASKYDSHSVIRMKKSLNSQELELPEAFRDIEVYHIVCNMHVRD